MLNLLTYFRSSPRFMAWNSHPNQQSRVLITAGMDGDEYSSIEAAQQLINSYSGNIPITIIPITNLAGYQSGVSYNPLDGLYPKYVYPGSRWGSSTQRLMYNLSKFLKKTELWIDLHSGAKDERLNPFVWAQETNNPLVDSRIKKLLSSLPATTLYTKKNTIRIAQQIARSNTGYLLLESGEMGIINARCVNQHLLWISHLLKHLDKDSNVVFNPTYNTLAIHKITNKIPKKYLWRSPNTAYVGKYISN